LTNTDVFCFGNPNTKFYKVPKGIYHLKRVLKEVVSGVGDYGNKMGIPTVNGVIYFDDDYMTNPLIYCGSMRIVPKDKIKKKVNSGNLILIIGGKTGKDGIHGATFSSMLGARDLNLYKSVTDCGAGGLSSAVGELGEEIGCVSEVVM
jgi:phosphoribosylformylglycinamidine synthase